MKRALFAILALAALVIVGAASAHAEEDSSSLVIRPSTMKEGETKVFIDDGNKITVRRNGDALNIEVEGAEQTRKLTIVKTGEGEITIDRDGEVRRRVQVIGPGSSRVLIDGMPGILEKKRGEHSENWFVCPKDSSMLRVPKGKEEATYKCPVDGTVMEKKQGRGFTIWWGDGFVESHRL